MVRVYACMDSTALFDELGGLIFQDETSISDQTWNDLQNWNSRYEKYIITSTQDQLNMIDDIIKVDVEGFYLLQRIKKEWQIPETIIYRSTILAVEPDLSKLVQDPTNIELFNKTTEFYNRRIRFNLVIEAAYSAYLRKDFTTTVEILSKIENSLDDELKKILISSKSQLNNKS